MAQLLRESNRVKEVETFQLLMLNTRRRLIRVEQISQGTLDTILVHPREVFKSAIAARAAAIVLVHNHPSGDSTPSEADIKVTRDLIRAGQLLKIDVLDHVVLGHATEGRPKDYSSLRELGYFYSCQVKYNRPEQRLRSLFLRRLDRTSTQEVDGKGGFGSNGRS